MAQVFAVFFLPGCPILLRGNHLLSPGSGADGTAVHLRFVPGADSPGDHRGNGADGARLWAVREAGLRLPKLVGSAVTIVGALIIGEAAVTAGIVSAPVVIVVALTGIASFTIPRYSLGFAMRVLRFPLLLISGAFGMVGFSLP